MAKPFTDDPETVLETAAHNSYSAITEDDPENVEEDAWWLREQRLQHKSLHWLQRPSAVMVGFCVFAFAFATGIAASTRQMIQYKLACNSVIAFTGAETCEKSDVQVLISSLSQYQFIALAIATMIASGKVAPLSDKYGRKLFLFLLVLFQTLGKVASFYTMYEYPTLQFNKIIGADILANCMGGLMLVITIANCYSSDIAETHQRTYLLGLNMACLFVGMSTGPLAGNALLSWKTRNLSQGQSASNIPSEEFSPLRVELAIFLLLLAFIVFVLPESRGEKARSMSRSMSRSSLQVEAVRQQLNKGPVARFFSNINIFEPLRLILYPKDRVHRSRHGSLARTRIVVFFLIVVDCFVFSLAQPMGEVLVLYGIYKFNWNAKNLGYFVAISCSSRAFNLIVLSPVLTNNVLRKILRFKVDKKRFDSVDYALIIIGYLGDLIGSLVLKVAPTTGALLAGLTITASGSLASPALNSAVVKYFPDSMIGEVFASMAILKNLLQLVAPLLILGCYKTLVKSGHPERVFYVLAGAFAACLIIISFVWVLSKEEEEEPEAEVEPLVSTEQ